MLIRIVIICLVFSIFASSFLKRTNKKTKTNRKTKIISKIKAKTKVKNICEYQMVGKPKEGVPLVFSKTEEGLLRFPEKYQDSTAAINKAIKQTLHARKLIEEPNKRANELLSIMAEGLVKFIETFGLGTKSGNNIVVNNPLDKKVGINRQTGAGYVWENTTNVIHIHSLLNKIRINDPKKTKVQVNEIERLGFLGFIGDIAEKMLDYNITKHQKDSKSLEYKIYNYMKNKVQNSTEFQEEHDEILVWKNSVIPKATKINQRGTCVKNQGEDEKILDPRSGGVLNVGENHLDRGLKDFISLKWQMQTVPKSLMDSCKDEPFAGHFSGSIVEILWLMDLLTFEHHKEEMFMTDPKMYLPTYKKHKDINFNLNHIDRKIKAGLASAFLISTGMHSAVEVSVTVRQYLRADTTLEVTSKLVCESLDDQTEYISNLMIFATEPKKKKILK